MKKAVLASTILATIVSGAANAATVYQGDQLQAGIRYDF